MKHELKCDPVPFQALVEGRKTYEIRKDDRGFLRGDILFLREWDATSGYSGRTLEAAVTYKTEGGYWGLPHGLCVLALALKPADRKDTLEKVRALADRWFADSGYDGDRYFRAVELLAVLNGEEPAVLQSEEPAAVPEGEEPAAALLEKGSCGHPRPVHCSFVPAWRCEACNADWAVQEQGLAPFVFLQYRQRMAAGERPVLDVPPLSEQAAAKLMSGEGRTLRTKLPDGRQALTFVPFKEKSPTG